MFKHSNRLETPIRSIIISIIVQQHITHLIIRLSKRPFSLCVGYRDLSTYQCQYLQIFAEHA